MLIALITNSISPHQMPLATCLAGRVGDGNFRYIATERLTDERKKLGWNSNDLPKWVLQPAVNNNAAQEAQKWSSNADIVLCGNRDIELFKTRMYEGKITLYMSERWFKPPWGVWRMFHPAYCKMCFEVVKLLKSPCFFYLPIGVYSAKDMHRICSMFNCIAYNSSLKILLWGYFVGISNPHQIVNIESDTRLKILWFGRFLKLKRTDLLIQAVRELDPALQQRLSVKIMGMGPQEGDLRRRIARYQLTDCIEISPPKPIEAVRQEIREADICVVTSNAQEGWGVAVNEIMIEGRCIVVSDGSGAGVTMVRHCENGLLFQDGSSRDLAAKLELVITDENVRHELAENGRNAVLAEWLPETAADRILELSEALLAKRPYSAPNSGPLSVV